jgi:hypothetical protein
MLKLLINNGDGKGNVDYTHYVISSSINIQDSLNTPALFSFTLSNVDGQFKAPVRSAYVQFQSTMSPLSVSGANIITGFVTNSPQWRFIGVGPRASAQRFQHYELDIKVTSDEYLLNMKSVPFVAAYVNQTMGQILANIAESIAPGYFDLSGIQDADIVPFYSYDPTQTWSDVAKAFGDQSQYHYYSLGKKIYFVPYGDQPLGITYNEVTQTQEQFVPGALNTGVLAVPIVNDCICIGDVEPQQCRDDYFVGDGFTGSFPLKYSMFHGENDIVLQDDWTENQFNTSLWSVQDPLGQFLLAGALNSIGVSGAIGQSYILAQSGVELGGSLVLQHGEFQFNDVSVGILGGLYGSLGGLTQQLTPQNCLAGFDVRTAPNTTVTITASGANGIQISPMISGALVGTPVVSKQNHHYILQTSISARFATRYQPIYRNLAGTVFGNQYLPSVAEVTFTITDVDLAQAYNIATLNNPFVPQYTPAITTYTSSAQNLPSFAAYAILNSQFLNLTLNYTLGFQSPTALLQVAALTGAQVTNPIALTGGQLPPYDPDDPLSMPLGIPIGPYYHYPLGFGMENVTATIAQNGDTDQLQFYSIRIPGVGARIRFQAWQKGHAVSRIQDPVSIAQEALIVGDDGHRTAVVSDLSPLPRTSYECDYAAQAYITDREAVQYDGDYNVESYFANPFNDYPRSGRFFNVTAPQRGLSGEQLLVRSVTTTVLELYQEILQYDVSFGQDLYLEKTLKRFLPVSPANTLTPTETAIAPNPQNLPVGSQVFTTYLDNLENAKLSFISGTQVTVDLGAPPITGVEVRRSDTGWGFNKINVIGTFTTQKFTLPRTLLDQTWYMRMVNGTQSSRFTRAFRVNYPMVPQPPPYAFVFPGASIGGVQLTQPELTAALPLTFDKNIYGLQVDTGPLIFPNGIQVQVVSDQAGDTRTVSVLGTDVNGKAVVSQVQLNGTTPVVVPQVFYTLTQADILV